MRIIIILLLLKLSISYFNINIKNRIIKNQIIKNILMKTCYPNDENDKRKRRRDIIINMPYFDMTYFDTNYFNKSASNTSYLDTKKNFILIADDCEECKELLQTMDKLNIKYSYIDKELYLRNIINDDKNFINLLFYKEFKLIGFNLFDVYEEIYSET